MVFLLGELLQLLISRDGQDKITKEEWDFFANWRANALRSSLVGGSVATGLVFVATRKLNMINRFSLSGGAGVITGYWRLQESFKTCVDQILSLDGSRMQHELKKIILQRYGDDPYRMRTFSKYFYGEEVYNDSNPEHPRLIYRQRHVFMDNPKVYDVSDADEQQQTLHQKNSDSNTLKSKGPNSEIKKLRINPGISMYGYGDPLEVLFGYASANEEAEQPDTPGDVAKIQGRTKRVRRRQRMRQRQQKSLSLGEAQLL